MKYLVCFLISSLLGLAVSLVSLLAGILVKPFVPLCDIVLFLGSHVADALPGGGMHNPMAGIIGLIVNGIILGVPLWWPVLSVMRKRVGAGL